MKSEDIAALNLINQGNVGEVTFVRYALSAKYRTYTKIVMHIKEALEWISATLENKKLKDIYASANPEQTVWLVTIQFENHAMANLFMDFTRTKNSFIKQTEIAGTKGLYLFDSTVENAYQVDFLEEDIDPEADLLGKGVGDEWWKLIENSIENKEVVLQKE